MAVPRSRLSNARKNKRRAHHAKEKRNVIACSNCGVATLPHTVCSSCGVYAKKTVFSQASE